MSYTIKSLRNAGFSQKRISTYQATQGKEKVAYKKGFEACLALLTQDWGQISREDMISKGNMIIGLLDISNHKGQS
jgi:hypothetical protein